jgi:exopolysaccharide biosynthesis protein
VARVREVRSNGNTPLKSDILVLSIGPKLAPRLPKIQAGDTVRIFTETIPDLTGVTTAIGGGPTLVRDGVAQQWSNLQMRHPRSALGYSKDYIYLVVVDGRQFNVSDGMTFPELATFMVKLGCEQAMNLDGGGSSMLWISGQIISNPSEGQERPSANALVVVRKKTASK